MLNFVAKSGYLNQTLDSWVMVHRHDCGEHRFTSQFLGLLWRSNDKIGGVSLSKVWE